MQHEMKIKAVYFDKIKSGEKTYEVRLNDEKRRMIQVGDVVVLKREPELQAELSLRVRELLYFSSFEQLVDKIPLEKLGFTGMTKQTIVDVYHQFYTTEQEKMYGVVVIKF